MTFEDFLERKYDIPDIENVQSLVKRISISRSGKMREIIQEDLSNVFFEVETYERHYRDFSVVMYSDPGLSLKSQILRIFHNGHTDLFILFKRWGCAPIASDVPFEKLSDMFVDSCPEVSEDQLQFF